VTLAESLLHLVRAGARIDRPSDAEEAGSSEAPTAVATEALAGETPFSDASQAASQTTDAIERLAVELAAEAAPAPNEYELGLADLEAAVELVSRGLASRVTLAGFPSRPGLLWRAYRLADANGVVILPTLARGSVTRPGRRVDILITRDLAANG
jgi:hypothetical protein